MFRSSSHRYHRSVSRSMCKTRSKAPVTPLVTAIFIKVFRRRPPTFAVPAAITVNACLPTVWDCHAACTTALTTTPTHLAQIRILPSRRAGLRPWTRKARKARSGADGPAGHKDSLVGPEPGGGEELTSSRVALHELVPKLVGVDPRKFCAVNVTSAAESFQTEDDVLGVISTFFVKFWLERDTRLPRMGLGVEQKDKVCELVSG